MSFWRQHMPRGMYLRSGLDWHLDPLEVKTLAAYLELRGIPEQEAQPLPVELFLDYAQWFQDEYASIPRPRSCASYAGGTGASRPRWRTASACSPRTRWWQPGLDRS